VRWFLQTDRLEATMADRIPARALSARTTSPTTGTTDPIQLHANVPTLAAFSAWLAERQQIALDGMQSATGEAFAQHSADFCLLSSATTVLMHFNDAALRQEG